MRTPDSKISKADSNNNQLLPLLGATTSTRALKVVFRYKGVRIVTLKLP